MSSARFVFAFNERSTSGVCEIILCPGISMICSYPCQRQIDNLRLQICRPLCISNIRDIHHLSPHNDHLMTSRVSLLYRLSRSFKNDPYQIGPLSRHICPAPRHGLPHVRHASAGTFRSISSNRDFRILLVTIQFAAVGHFVVTNIASLAMTSGPSMLPTLLVDGDVVLISKYYRRGRGVKVGDVVSFDHPMVPEHGAMKRIVGLPGDFLLTGERDMKGERLMIQVSSL